MKLFLLLILSVFSTVVLAHGGHGESSAFAHALDHTFWVLGGVILFIGIYYFKRRQ